MSEKIARSIGKNSEEIEIIQYGLHQAFFMLINFITIIICGLLWQELIFSLVLFTAIYFIRPYAGGYHADTEIRCYFLSVERFIQSMVIQRISGLEYSEKKNWQEKVIYIFSIIYTVFKIQGFQQPLSF